MVDSQYNTLLIIEGESYEKKFFDKFISIISENKDIKIVPFKNNIYSLYRKITRDYDGFTTTKDVILEHCKMTEEERNVIKNTKFVNTFLVFDLDLQDKNDRQRELLLNRVKKMLELFSDETGYYGKLFINYPMMESYRHFYFSDIKSLKNKQVESTQEVLTNYKNIVDKEGTNKNVKQYKINDFYKIALAHLCQANMLLNGKFRKPSKEEYNDIIEIQNIHEKQMTLILQKNYMVVLNTSSFLYAEYYPNMLKTKP